MNWTGCFPALVTPFDKQGKVCEKGLSSNIEWVIKKGVAGIIPCGTTGESPTISHEEHRHVVEVAVSVANGRVPVIAGAGSNNTSEAIGLAQFAEKAKADAVLCIVPYYNKPTQEGMYQHFKAIAESISIPLFLYNLPGRCVVNMLPETVERLCEIKNIVGIKEGHSDLVQVSEIHRRCGDRMTILSGDDALTLPMLSVGAKGVISVVGNIVPDLMGKMIDCFFDGKVKDAIEIHEKLLPFINSLFLETNPIPVKAALNHIGLSAGEPRLPLVKMSDANFAKMVQVMKSVGISQ
jgi:4-hydroxy-tetrahydrodipicolinate synthase